MQCKDTASEEVLFLTKRRKSQSTKVVSQFFHFPRSSGYRHRIATIENGFFAAIYPFNPEAKDKSWPVYWTQRKVLHR